MAGRLDGRIALVTGGSSGIGRATALAFADEGAKVIVAARRVQQGGETVATIRESGGEAVYIKNDVSKAAEVEAMVNKIIDTYGRLDCGFTNAGIEGIPGSAVECSEENWDRTISINLKGVWLCMKYEIPKMLESKSGAIVNNASVVGLVGSAMLPAYAASKHGVVGLTKSAALGYAQLGIRVNAVCPGLVQTPMADRLFDIGTDDGLQEEIQFIEQTHPIGRIGISEEVAEAVVWLCSDGASFITGQALAVDGGFVAR